MRKCIPEAVRKVSGGEIVMEQGRVVSLRVDQEGRTGGWVGGRRLPQTHKAQGTQRMENRHQKPLVHT